MPSSEISRLQNLLHSLCLPLPHRQARPTGITFVDSSKLQVGHNLRIFRY
ncbi:Mobile element protein [Candidatus Enterovibrio escicola]|uniref:Mobile element protein n=1 Tax=Candidatus Enterovibrio escicola TaxID=1927127 RepID=A0A2A5T6C6_9GAMM|nr:Mobile element protein [Candidatus Enterovibrio escacola]